MPEKDKNIHTGHRQRLLKKLRETDDGKVISHEMLEALLFYVIPRSDTNPLAHRLIDTFGSVEEALNSEPEELMKVRGIGEKTAKYLNLLGKFGRGYSRVCHQRIEYNLYHSSTQKYLKNLFHDIEREQVYMLFLDGNANVIKRMLMFEGTFESVDIDLREMLRVALNCEARSVVCVHNHPSEIARPSRADRLSTAKMQETFEMIGVVLVDSIIVTKKAVFGILSSTMIEFNDNQPI